MVDGLLLSIDAHTHFQNRAQELLRPISKWVAFPTGNSPDVLRKMGELGRIDFLYLDSMGPGTGDYGPAVPPGGFEYQRHSLEEIKAAAPLLHADSVILLDDDDRGHARGKPFFTRQWLTLNGWTCVLEEYQSVWIMEDGR